MLRRTHINLILIIAIPVCCGAAVCHAQSVAQPSPRQLLRKQMELVEMEKQESMAMLRKLQTNLESNFSKLDKVNISDFAFADVMKLLQVQRIELLIDIAGLEARQEKLSTSQQEKLELSILENEVELAKVKLELVSREFEFTKKLASKGTMSSMEVERAKYQLKVTEQELRQKELSWEQARSGLEYSDTLIELVEKKARLKKIDSILSEQTQTRNTINEMENLKDRIRAERTRMKSLEAQLSLLQQKANALDIVK